MTLKASGIAAALLLLTACAELNAPGVGPTVTTPTTAWTEANARYSLTQHRAVEYARRCDRDHALFLSRCRMVVDELNDIDGLAETVQDDGYSALDRKDTVRLHEKTGDLNAVTDEMNRVLDEEGVQ